MRVLVVEDELLLAMDLEDVLQGLGHEVVATAQDFAGAVAAAARHRPDVVIMDIDLGHGPDGVETAAEILSFLGIRSIFVTAHTQDESRALGAGALAFLRKPLDVDRLERVLAAAPAPGRGAG